MKIAKLIYLYPAYIKSFYKKYPKVIRLDYKDHLRRLEYDAFGHADAWTNPLISLGYKTTNFIANNFYLQRKWAFENNLKFNSNNWQFEILLAQIKNFSPDILYITGHNSFNKKWIEEIKLSCSSIKFSILWCGAPFSDPEIFSSVDLTLSDTPEIIEKITDMGYSAKHLNHAFDRRILDRINLETPPKYDFTFVGSIARRKEYHCRREEILRAVASKTNLNLFSPNQVSLKDKLRFAVRLSTFKTKALLHNLNLNYDLFSRLTHFDQRFSVDDPPRYPISPDLIKKMSPPVFGLNMFQTLRDSKITFNCHIDISYRTANNLRLYEATGVGACLLTDARGNLCELFEPEKEVVTYSSVDECIDKVKWLLANPEKRKAIAFAGQERTLKDHTWEKRAIEFDKLIKEAI